MPIKSTVCQVIKNNTYNCLYENRFLCFVVFFFFPSTLLAKNIYGKADSIILKVLENRSFYCKYIEEYEATAYIKGGKYVKKKNLLYRYAPDFFYLDKKEINAFVESVVDIHFKAPNYFTQQVLALNGTKTHMDDIRERVMQFLNVNIYNPSIFNNHILIPGVKDVFKYYRFEYVSLIDTLNHRIHQIRIIPKIRSQQLISGFLYVTNDLWTIYQMNIEGKWEFSKFRVETKFGLPGKDFLLPLETDITLQLNLLGNEVISHYFSSFQYKEVKKFNPHGREKTINFDLSDYYNVPIDSLPAEKDEIFWEENRSIPLTLSEEFFFESNQKKKEAANIINDSPKTWNFLSRGVVSPKRFKYNDSQMSYSGLLNPFKFSYSKLDGIVYWQEFRYKKLNDAGQDLQFNPKLGILFQREELYFTAPLQWLFNPSKMGEICFTVQNRNRVYSSTLIDMIEKEMPDSIHFDDFNLKYYHHYTSRIEGQYEIRNGLLFRGGIKYDWYIPVKDENRKGIEWRSEIVQNEDVADLITDQYRVFLPTVGLTWTPYQYYRIKGKRKEYVGSNFPTLSAQCSWGIKGILKSNSDYMQVEADIQQKISVGLMSSFQYYFSAGRFLKTRSLYFADFNLFQKRNFPQSWDDPIGGVFQLLRGEWYNASPSYAQAHLTYEFPYTLLRLFKNVTKDILKERVYLSQLYTPVMPCYTEIGYGVGNFIGDAGVFVSFVKGRYESVGATFTLGLGR